MIEHSCVSMFMTARKIINFFCEHAPIDWFMSPPSITIFLKQNFILQDFTGRIIAPNFCWKLNQRFLKNWILQYLQWLPGRFCPTPFIRYFIELFALWSRRQSFFDGDTHLSVTKWIYWQSWFIRILIIYLVIPSKKSGRLTCRYMKTLCQWL